MANLEHVQLLKQGVEAWNKWRKCSGETPDLDKLEMIGEYLGGANFSGAILAGAKLKDVNLWKANLVHANLRGADLTGADLTDANLNLGNLTRTNLTKAKMSGAYLIGTILVDAILKDVDLTEAEFTGANLTKANMSGARISRAIFNSAILTGADLKDAVFGDTIVVNVDLRDARNLDLAKHRGPSNIGIETIYRSAGQINETFLRGAGIPDTLIQYIPSLFKNPLAIEFYSCFISYSHKDEAFAQRLHSALRDKHLRVWYAPEDIKAGQKLHDQIDEAIRLHDKLLLVLSDNSILSEWVMTEIRKARKRELNEKRRVLFPIRLTDMTTLKEWTCFDADSGKDLAVEVREYFIPDFSKWKDHDSFERSFERLVKDLKNSEKGA